MQLVTVFMQLPVYEILLVVVRCKNAAMSSVS